MKAILKIGRFQRYEEFFKFLTSLQKVGREFSVRTETEEKLVMIRKHLREDLKKGVKPHDDGLDPKSIVLKEQAILIPVATVEARQLEAKSVAKMIKVTEQFLIWLKEKHETLSDERGGVVLIEHQRVIREAKKRIAEKEATAQAQ